MTGHELRAQLMQRPGEDNGFVKDLTPPVAVDSKIRIHGKVEPRKLLISRVWPRAYETTTGFCRAFWPMFDCAISGK